MNEVADYVAQVRVALADLPAAVRDELLEDLPEHLAEVAAESEGSLAERLGPPTAYAAELRAAAGAPMGGRRRLTVGPLLRDAVGQARARLRVVDAKGGPIIGYEKVSDSFHPLRPAWWVLRGYLVAMALAHLATDDPIGLLPRFEIGDRTFTGMLVLVVFVVASIWQGLHGSRLSRGPRVAMGIATALLMLPGLASIHRADDDAAGYPSSYQEVSDGYRTVDSVYVFDEHGRPLLDARIFDRVGNPIPASLDWPAPFQVPPAERERPEGGPTGSPAPTPAPSATR